MRPNLTSAAAAAPGVGGGAATVIPSRGHSRHPDRDMPLIDYPYKCTGRRRSANARGSGCRRSAGRGATACPTCPAACGRGGGCLHEGRAVMRRAHSPLCGESIRKPTRRWRMADSPRLELAGGRGRRHHARNRRPRAEDSLEQFRPGPTDSNPLSAVPNCSKLY